MPSDVAQQPTNSEASRIDRLRETFRSSKRQETSKFNVPVIIRSLDHYPRGYPKVAAYQDCDGILLIYRKLGWLHNHVLLDLQGELQALEGALEEHNAYTLESGEGNRLRARRFDYNRPGPRQELISEIREKLTQYDDLLLRTQKVQAIKRPTDRAQNSLYNFISCGHHILQSGNEARWICRSDDLASISRDAESGWLNEAVESVIAMISKRLLLKLFRTREQKIRTGSQRGFYLVSPHRMEILLRAILTVIVLALVVVPGYILLTLQATKQSDITQQGHAQFGIICVFTLIFSASYSGLTKANRHEAFLVTAAYAAVLLMFLGLAGVSNNLLPQEVRTYKGRGNSHMEGDIRSVVRGAGMTALDDLRVQSCPCEDNIARKLDNFRILDRCSQQVLVWK